MVDLLGAVALLVACHRDTVTSMRGGIGCLRKTMVAEVMCEMRRSLRMVVAHRIWDMVG